MPTWSKLLEDEFSKPYYCELKDWVKKEYQTKTIYPSQKDIFNALKYTPYAEIKVLILGQDPYQTPDFAHGLAFSVNHGVVIPRSLQNIFKELSSDLGCHIPNHGCLEKWAKQGVMLLNTTLTVEKGKSNSHQGKGWEIFTDRIIQLVNEKESPIVFILWGSNAKLKKSLITNPKHLVIESTHPSPFSARNGFFNSKPFSRANEFLIQNKIQPVDWQIENI